MEKSKKPSFIDFVLEIIDNCSIETQSGSTTTPFDINYTNHYKTLYEFDKCAETATVKDITHNNKNKSITVNYENKNCDFDNIKEYCEQNNIGFESNNKKSFTIEINKKTKGVLEERKWNQVK